MNAAFDEGGNNAGGQHRLEEYLSKRYIGSALYTRASPPRKGVSLSLDYNNRNTHFARQSC